MPYEVNDAMSGSDRAVVIDDPVIDDRAMRIIELATAITALLAALLLGLTR